MFVLSAQEIASNDKRQTIKETDILQALEDLDFGDFIPEIQEFLQEKKVIFFFNSFHFVSK